MSRLGGHPICAFVGPNGGGKTLCMVEELALPALRAGMPVLSNFEIRHPLWRPLESWRQLVEAHDCVILLDEITSVLPSREAMSLPAQLGRVTNQLRKARVRVGWSAPAFARADVMLREVTLAVVVCRGTVADRWVRGPGVCAFPRRGPLVRGPGGDRVRVEGWRPNCLFRFSLFDGVAMEEFQLGRAEKLPRLDAWWYWRPAHEAGRLYDSLAPVGLLDHLDSSGLCMDCGGTRRRHQCKCDRASV